MTGVGVHSGDQDPRHLQLAKLVDLSGFRAHLAVGLADDQHVLLLLHCSLYFLYEGAVEQIGQVLNDETDHGTAPLHQPPGKQVGHIAHFVRRFQHFLPGFLGYSVRAA